jgi:hypothetical protein
MENQFDNTLTNEMENKGKRPQFLTVLCVLSFICVALMIIIAVMGEIMNTPENMQQQIERVREFSPAQAEQMEANYIKQQESVMGKIQNYILILIELVSLLGVIMMFNLKKVGFYIYAAIEILPYSLMIFSAGDASVDMGGQLGAGAVKAVMIIFVLIDLAFVVMYGLNLKHMKK